MQSILDTFLSGQILAFMLIFARMGSTFMIMPGIGDGYVNTRVRLCFAIGVSLVLSPMIYPLIPVPMPTTHTLILLIIFELIIGIFLGTIARIFMMALDTGGMIISMQAGLANAQVLNPALATQGSLVGAFLTVTGVVIIFSTNLHHLLIMGVMESYQMFPIGSLPDTGSMAEVISRAVSSSFLIGVKIAMPFIVLTLLIYAGMGVMSRLMPQIQVFMVAIPLQIMISFILISFSLTAILYYWATQYEAALFFFFSNGAILQ